MDKRANEVLGKYEEDSSILSPTWQTSGITMGSQVLSGTAGLSILFGEPSTAAERLEGYFEFIEVEQEVPIAFPEENNLFWESIEKAKKEMRRGVPYLTHDDVFGD